MAALFLLNIEINKNSLLFCLCQFVLLFVLQSKFQPEMGTFSQAFQAKAIKKFKGKNRKLKSSYCTNLSHFQNLAELRDAGGFSIQSLPSLALVEIHIQEGLGKRRGGGRGGGEVHHLDSLHPLQEWLA